MACSLGDVLGTHRVGLSCEARLACVAPAALVTLASPGLAPIGLAAPSCSASVVPLAWLPRALVPPLVAPAPRHLLPALVSLSLPLADQDSLNFGPGPAFWR